MSDNPLPGQMALFDTKLLLKPDPERLLQLKQFALSCRKCGLRSGCKQVVFGEGCTDRPSIAFIGEGPGANEDSCGRPFIGKAGELLNSMLRAMEIPRSSVYICNIVCCRPPENRVPTREEAGACREWLVGQLRYIQPRVLVALGGTAANALLETKKTKTMHDLRKEWHEWQGIPMRATFHPAFLLRNPTEKSQAWSDLQEVLKMLKSAGA